MSGALYSPHWYRVAQLKPHLRAHVQVQRHRYRDQIWYHLADQGSGRRHRLNQAAYRFAGRLDGHYTVDEAWQAVVAEHGDDALTQAEAIRVLGQLGGAELLQCELTPDLEALFQQQREQRRRKRWLELNPLVIRLRLFDPSRWLARFDPWLASLFRSSVLTVWLALVLPAVLLAAGHWEELRAFAATHVDTPRFLFIAWLAYPLLKALHELGHALAVRRWGGEVHDVGLNLFLFVPVPYVDASAAAGFTSRHQRAIVSAIGIMVELLIAAMALYVWLNVQPGWIHDIAFVVMLIAGVSTLVFNGNPLLRFDGYHLLCDLMELPNLDSRSRAWWNNLIQRRVFRIELPALPLAAGEAKWMALYAPLALGYRLYIGVLMVLWVGAKSALLGLIIAISTTVMLLFMPAAAMTRELGRLLQGRARQRTRRAAVAAVAALILVAVLVPLPYSAVAQAVVWLPEQAQARAETAGFVTEVRVRDGDHVTPGQVLAVLDDPDLLTSQTKAQSRLAALRVQQYHALQTDRVQAANLTRAISHAQTEVARIDARVAQLEIRSQTSGRMAIPRQHDLPGAYLKQGQPLGYVLAADEVMVRAVVSQQDAALVRKRSRSAEVQLAEHSGELVRGVLRRETPAATFKLPSAALADHNGGAQPTDPADPEHLRTLAPVFMFDVALPESAIARIGGRAWVRFDFGNEPLVVQSAHAFSQFLLEYFKAGA